MDWVEDVDESLIAEVDTLSEAPVGDDDVDRLVELVGSGDVGARLVAIRGVFDVAHSNRRPIETRYPTIADELLDSEESLVVARELLHEAASLRQRDVAPVTVVNGFDQALDFVFETALPDVEAKAGTADGMVPGGGATPVELAHRLRNRADSVSGREQLVFGSVADALEAIAGQYALAAGADPIDTLVDLRARREDAPLLTSGIGSNDGRIVDTATERGEVPARRLLNRITAGAGTASLVTLVERSPAQLLRVEATLTERI